MNVPGLREDTEIALMARQVDEIEERQPYLDELPLLDGEGRIMRVLTKSPVLVESHEFAWGGLEKGYLPSKFRKYDKIYLSSLENHDIFEFYGAWKDKLSLEILSSDNISNAFHGKDNLLIYAADVFPECNKISIFEFWDTAARFWIEKKLSFVLLKDDWASLTEVEADSLDKIIRCFDDGNKSVVVIDEVGTYKSTIISSTFARDFPSRHIARWNNIFAYYQENKKHLRRDVATICFASARRDVPILLEGKVVGMGRLCDSNVEEVMREEPFFPKLCWNLIGDDIVREFFAEYKKILISSEGGDLKMFKERFDGLLDITVYSDDILGKYLAGEFDVLICGADVWPGSHAVKYTVRSLYINLLSREVYDYLASHNVDYYYLSIGRPQLNGNVRIASSVNTEHMPGLDIHEGGAEYYTHADGAIVSRGARHTDGVPDQYDRSVYFYGACTVEGAFVDSSETIESLIQYHINKAKFHARVINKGCAGVDYEINALHMIANTVYEEGDVILHLSRIQNRSAMVAQRGKMLFAEDIFEPHSVQHLKVYADNDSPGHLTAEGNRLIADYLYEHLKGVFAKSPNRRKPILPFYKAKMR